MTLKNVQHCLLLSYILEGFLDEEEFCALYDVKSTDHTVYSESILSIAHKAMMSNYFSMIDNIHNTFPISFDSDDCFEKCY